MSYMNKVMIFLSWSIDAINKGRYLVVQSRTKKTSLFHIKIIILDWTNPLKEWAEYTIEYLMDNQENDWKIPLIKNVIVVDDFWLVP